MITKDKPGYSDTKLIAAFTVLILLTLCIGGIGIFQIRKLSQRVEELGRLNFPLEQAILQMRIDSADYASGIRNYVLWKVSRYLWALPSAANLDNALKSKESFQKQLEVYAVIARSEAVARRSRSKPAASKTWIPSLRSEQAAQSSSGRLLEQSQNYWQELTQLGDEIIALTDKRTDEGSDELIKNRLTIFENQLYRLNDFLSGTMGRENLIEIEGHLSAADAEKKKAVFSLSLILCGALGAGCFIAFSVYRRRKQEYLYRRQLFNQMINMEESQRKSLSAELHDQLGQLLSALKISLGIIEQNVGAVSEDIKNRFTQSKTLVSQLLDKSHNIAYLLRPPSLDEVGLAESIEELLLDYKHLSGINYLYHKPEHKLSLSPECNLILYRVAQELLNNMAKYSQAKNITIALEAKNGWVELGYQDDGVGFSYERIIHSPKRREEDRFKLGLAGLRERVELLEGAMRIDTAPSKGVKMKVRLKI